MQKKEERWIHAIQGSASLDPPIAWIRTNRLQKGDRLSIGLQEDGALRSQYKKFSMRD
jgi:hypothetical protein